MGKPQEKTFTKHISDKDLVDTKNLHGSKTEATNNSVKMSK